DGDDAPALHVDRTRRVQPREVTAYELRHGAEAGAHGGVRLEVERQRPDGLPQKVGGEAMLDLLERYLLDQIDEPPEVPAERAHQVESDRGSLVERGHEVLVLDDHELGVAYRLRVRRVRPAVQRHELGYRA